MDDLLLFTLSRKVHMDNLGRSFESIEKEWSEDISKEMPVI